MTSDKRSTKSFLTPAINRWGLTELEVPELPELEQLFQTGTDQEYRQKTSDVLQRVRALYENTPRPAAIGEFVSFRDSSNKLTIGRIISVSYAEDAKNSQYLLELNYSYSQRDEPLTAVIVFVSDCTWLDPVQDSAHPHYIDCSDCF